MKMGKRREKGKEIEHFYTTLLFQECSLTLISGNPAAPREKNYKITCTPAMMQFISYTSVIVL